MDEILTILQQNNVPSTFLDIMLVFGQKPGNGAAGSAQSAFQHKPGPEFGSYLSTELAKQTESHVPRVVVQYNLTYVELAEGRRADDIRYWTTRQIGVYQHYVANDDTGFCLLLQCQKRSKAQKTIDRLQLECGKGSGKGLKLLFDVHTAILSAYFRNWQAYLTILNNCFEDIVSIDSDPRKHSAPRIKH
ncbi:MAG: hypothetical protein Q9180_006514 [Flavoplaca navasiana]